MIKIYGIVNYLNTPMINSNINNFEECVIKSIFNITGDINVYDISENIKSINDIFININSLITSNKSNINFFNSTIIISIQYKYPLNDLIINIINSIITDLDIRIVFVENIELCVYENNNNLTLLHNTSEITNPKNIFIKSNIEIITLLNNYPFDVIDKFSNELKNK